MPLPAYQSGIQVFLAYLIDLIVGDPYFLPHPVVLIGWLIKKTENFFRCFCRSNVSLFFAGLLTFAGVVLLTWTVTFLVVNAAYLANFWFGFMLSTWIISTTIAVKGLSKAGNEIRLLVQCGDLGKARLKTGYIVSRDTSGLEEKDLIRAVVETVAENIVDAVVAPMFYAFLGGAPLAMAYRAVNTLDSMLGYKNEKYLYFGKAAARADDIANFIPARLTGALLLLTVFILRMDVKRAWKSIWRDSRHHPSPNSGIPEAVVAGALGIRLGGTNIYGGQAHFRAYMGDDIFPLKSVHIEKTVKLLYLSSALAALTCLFISISLIKLN